LLAKAKTGSPEKFVQRHFDKRADGSFTPKKSPHSWETRSIELVPQNPGAIRGFIERNSGKMTPMSVIALEALAAELAKKGRR
jgi:hypothetical protein